MKHIDCVIQQVRLCDRRNFDRTAPVIAKAQLNPLDLKQIDDAAFLLDCTRTEFIPISCNQHSGGLPGSAKGRSSSNT